MQKDRDRFFAGIVLLQNLFVVLAAAMASVISVALVGNIGLVYGTVLTTLVLALFGEFTPKVLAAQSSERYALFVARPVEIVLRLVGPLMTVLSKIPQGFRRLVFGPSPGPMPTVTEAELRMLIDIGTVERVLGEQTGELLENVFQFRDRQVQEIMVPRTEVVWLEADATVGDFYRVFDETGHSRYPVYRESVDNVLGVVSIKDVLRGVARGEISGDMPIESRMRPTYFVPETKPVGVLFREMQSREPAHGHRRRRVRRDSGNRDDRAAAGGDGRAGRGGRVADEGVPANRREDVVGGRRDERVGRERGAGPANTGGPIRDGRRLRAGQAGAHPAGRRVGRGRRLSDGGGGGARDKDRARAGDEETMKIQRLRVRFARGEEVKYVTHLDLMRLWERALRRANIDMAYSEGFTPHAQLSLAAPLAVGMTSEGELLDVFLASRMTPLEFMRDVCRQLPAGIEALEVEEVGLRGPSLQAELRAAEYDVSLPSTVAGAQAREAVDSFLAAESVPWEQAREGEVRRYDIRQMVQHLWVERVEERDTGRRDAGASG